MKRNLLLFLLLALLLTGCAAVDKSDPILFETMERKEYISVLWEGREYVPFSGGYTGFRGRYLGHLEGEDDEEIYAWSGHDEKEWLISYLNSGIMNNSMLLREVHVTEYPNGIESDYWWNYQANEDEFVIIVELDTAEDIYVVSCDYFLDGEVIGGRLCTNADGTAIWDYVYENFLPEDLPENADLNAFSVRFYLSTQPDGTGNVYDAAAHLGEVPVENEVAVSAAYGDVYFVRISGSEADGYQAELYQED